MGILGILLVVLAVLLLIAVISRLLGQTIGLPNDIVLLVIVLLLLGVFFRGNVHFRL